MTRNYPARAHAAKVVAELAKLIPEADRGKMHGIFLQASPTLYRDDTDRELLFHQEANFNYLSGVIHSSCSIAVFFSLATSNISHNLFIPPEDPAETMWSVPPPSLEQAEALFDSDKIQYTTSLPAFLESAVQCAPNSEVILHTLPSTMEYPALPKIIEETQGPTRTAEYLLTALHIARLTKDSSEIELIRKANQISSGAHEVVMRELGKFARDREGSKGKESIRTGKEGLTQWEIESEGDAEAVFVASCRRMGATTQAYLPIVASGSRASTLHYVCNDRLFPSTSVPRQPGDTSFTPPRLARGCCGTFAPSHSHVISPTDFHSNAFTPQVLLIDAGCEWQGYASDITRTIPVGNGGRFTKEAGEIYDLVLRMQQECEALVKPGIHWDRLHLHAHKVLIDGFLQLGIFKGDTEQILQSGVTAGFFPHGLGHSLGLDVHDSRQYLKSVHEALPESSQQTPSKLYAYLRIRRPLAEGMVLTIEPGCYFAPQLMDEHGVWSSEFVDKEVLERYVGVGGVRIEDVVVVTSGVCENLTTIGRDREWIEKVCSGVS
ncbi:hypothetical protein I302_108973 [Kwoniella bestiolae CBS 10118]|uniref:Xaa-Pro dipeptidase n=1 Tax=Kwoniella bestiolae CBS 10118 TaxID=1296100 RepID=A0A1B9FUM7_9TREE|nr:xaa-Pro dipeptidase [Kwoniella bestiolae CBS 10118]OCF22465.1 xaa-Pro dipeptidase [Kwoniella bestiolae CBS 10118]